VLLGSSDPSSSSLHLFLAAQADIGFAGQMRRDLLQFSDGRTAFDDLNHKAVVDITKQARPFVMRKGRFRH